MIEGNDKVDDDLFYKPLEALKESFLDNSDPETQFEALNKMVTLYPHEVNIDSFDYNLLEIIHSKDSHRDQIIEIVKRSRTTVYERLDKLMRRNVLDKYKKKGLHRRGRPFVYWTLQKGWEKALLNGSLYSKVIIDLKVRSKERRTKNQQDNN